MQFHEHRHSGAPCCRGGPHSCAHLAVAHHTRKTHTFSGIMHAGSSLLGGILSSSSTTVPDYLFASALGHHLAYVNHASGRAFTAAASCMVSHRSKLGASASHLGVKCAASASSTLRAPRQAVNSQPRTPRLALPLTSVLCGRDQQAHTQVRGVAVLVAS